jgi:hypothetical protein
VTVHNSILHMRSEKEVQSFFYAALCISLSPEVKEHAHPASVAHKAAVLGSMAWLSAQTWDPARVRLLNHIARNIPGALRAKDQRTLEYTGDIALLHTGFFRNGLKTNQLGLVNEYTKTGAEAYLLASDLEKNKKRQEVLARSGMYFQVWQEELNRFELFLRSEMPWLIAPVTTFSNRIAPIV